MRCSRSRSKNLRVRVALVIRPWNAPNPQHYGIAAIMPTTTERTETSERRSTPAHMLFTVVNQVEQRIVHETIGTEWKVVSVAMASVGHTSVTLIARLPLF